MKKSQAKHIIVNVLQKAIPLGINNPQFIADAIIQKIDFESTLSEIEGNEILETIIERIEDCKKDLDDQFESLNPKEETLLRNFIRGKSIAYEEILDILNKL